MILIGHPFVPFDAFVSIVDKDDIAQTASGSTVVFTFDEKQVALCHYASVNEVSFALRVKDAREVILASALGAGFIVCDKGLVVKAQKFADDYLFDAKILLESNDESDITYAAEHSIDGILFEEGIKNGNS